MNYSTSVMLINPDIRAIKVSYEPSAYSPSSPSTTTYKTLDASVAVGDYVTIPTDTRHKMTVGKVEEVDVDVDFEDDKVILWAIDKVDIATNSTILDEERKWINQFKAAQKLKKREELKASLTSYFEDGSAETVGIANMRASGDVAALESK